MNELIRAFSHLEKICNEMYKDKHGVSLYIEEMKRETSLKTKSIPGWSSDLERLKHLRYIRNGIAHDDQTVDTSYTDSDVAFLEEMYDRIIAGTDPIGQLRRQQKELQVAKTKPVQSIQHAMEEYDDEPSDTRRTILAAAIIALLLILAILIGMDRFYSI